MKITFSIFLLLHGLIHLLGFAKAFQLAEISQLSQNISRPAGLVWLLAGLLFLSAALLFFGKNGWWWVVGALAIIVSQTLIFSAWQDAKFGTVANLLVMLPVLASFFSWQFEQKVEAEIEAIFPHGQASPLPAITSEQLAELPAPVSTWLETAGIIGRTPVQTAHFQQSGQLRLDPEKDWTPFTAEQYVNLTHPAFIWKAKNPMLPLLEMAIRDRYANGRGNMLVKLWSAIPVVNAANEKIDEATLQRFLAEVVWAPSAALQPYIRWEATGASSARATMAYRGVSGSVVLHFGESGAVASVEAQRFMDSGPGAERHTWLIEIEKNEWMSGLLIPSEISLSWRLPEGDFKWMEMRVEKVDYEPESVLNK